MMNSLVIPTQITLESLPNELFLDLFHYFSLVHVLRAFHPLNIRFHTLISIHCQQSSLDLRLISKTNFHQLHQNSLSSFIHHIRSLHLSNDDHTPQQITLLFQHEFHLYQFTHLQILSLSSIDSFDLLNRCLIDCSHLPSLTHLFLNNCHLSIDQHNVDHLYNQIWNLPKLTHTSLDISFINQTYFPTPTIISTSLQSLIIPNISCHVTSFIHLLKHTPNLQSLVIHLIDHSLPHDISQTLPLQSIIRLTLSFDCSSTLLQNLLQQMFNLSHLSLETSQIYIDGYQWEDFISKYLLKLAIFQLKMRFSPMITDEDKENHLDQILNSFRTSFWIVEHQWFVRCHWYTSNEDHHLDFIDLFTLPYQFKDFLSYTGCILTKSTCSSDHLFWSFDQVKQLCFGSSHFQTSTLSRLRFSNIQHLSLSLPFNDHFLTIVSTLHRLKSLSLSINHKKNLDTISIQLQLLFDRAMNLSLLRFGSWISSNVQLPLIHHFSKSIRCLDFQGFYCGKKCNSFDNEQCDQLIDSPLGHQCKTLFIKVKSRWNIIKLVNEMPHLQALNVRCEDDHLSSTHDELVEWLQKNLSSSSSSSCVISRDTNEIHKIRLWIR